MSHDNSQSDASTSTVNAAGIDRDRLAVATAALQGILAGTARHESTITLAGLPVAPPDTAAEWAIHYADALLAKLSAPPGMSAVNAELLPAAEKVYAGLVARMDDANARRVPVPLFDGIADLHDALNSARASPSTS